ncbi:MAG: c-type cytochrome biogenesis protein CcmI [Betaproteobacteria bacterium]
MSSALLFILVAVALVAAALGFVLPTLLKARARGDAASRAAVSAEIYRQEVEELEQEVARGELPAGEAQSMRQEKHRRLMDDAREPGSPPPSVPRARAFALFVAVALPVVAVLLYFTVGKPGALGEDPPAPPADAAKGDYVEQLQKHLSRQPRDGRGWVLLARAQADRNEFKASADAYQKALTVSEKVAKDPGVLCEYADALGMAQGGSLAGRPAELIEKALAINPAHPAALEMAGSLAYEEGRFADAARYWRQLLADLGPGSERHAELSTAVERAERKAAVTLPR